MKIINLNESQYRRIFEDVTDSNFGSDKDKRFGAEVTNQALITTKDGGVALYHSV